MKNLKKTVSIIAIAALVSIAGLCRAQSYTYTYGGPYNGALEYSLPYLASLPPSYPGEPVNITADYLLLDLAMTNSSWSATDSIIAQMGWGDTAKYVTGLLYQVMHDNPVAFDQWAAVYCWSCAGFKNNPGHALYSFEKKLSQACPDTDRTAMLVIPAVIADVMVVDTVGTFDSTASIAKNMVRVDCQLLDTIKGKYVLTCPDIYKAGKKGASPQSIASPVPTFGVPATPGTCLQFEYSPEWRRTPSASGDVGMGSNPLYDSINGTWIKPDSEYIVFLWFMGLGAGNPTSFCFTVWPVLQGTCAGMYSVRSGHVYDPNDDFGMGANVSGGLTVSQWKSRLRARISVLTGE